MLPRQEKEAMEHRDFDDLTRSMSGEHGTRRAMLRLLAGGALGGLIARLGLSESAEANAKKREQHKSRAERQQTGPLHAEGRRNKKRKKKPKKRCDDFPVPLCPRPCQEARCDPATGTYVCRDKCPEGWSCCNDRCEPPCTNGCVEDPDQACICQKPPTAEDVYCALEHLCGPDPCPSGKEYVSSTCTCRSLCPEDCPAGLEQDPSTCECHCPNGNPMCAGACCPANTVTCWWTPHLPQRYCQLADGRWVCPIGWTGSRETGCFPPATPETIDVNGDVSAERRHASRIFDSKPEPRAEEGHVGAVGWRARRWGKRR
jgi:hypothetical protein